MLSAINWLIRGLSTHNHNPGWLISIIIISGSSSKCHLSFIVLCILNLIDVFIEHGLYLTDSCCIVVRWWRVAHCTNVGFCGIPFVWLRQTDRGWIAYRARFGTFCKVICLHLLSAYMPCITKMWYNLRINGIIGRTLKRRHVKSAI